MDDETRKRWLPFAILAAALVVWAGVFALGAYLEPGADQPRARLPQAADHPGHDGGISRVLGRRPVAAEPAEIGAACDVGVARPCRLSAAAGKLLDSRNFRIIGAWDDEP